jgi:DNA-binding response OmpR family regulator
MKVLIVEDNKDMRDLLRLVLERLYYVPVLAPHCKEGLGEGFRREAALDLDGHDDAGNGRLGRGESPARQS